jgi:chitin disaccharide deacetylase
MLKLIINADDLGLTPGCNAGIVRALSGGAISDTTLMVNCEYASAAVEMLQEKGIAKVGLHLNITYGQPVLPAGKVPSLVDDSGRFRRKVEQAVKLAKKEDVEQELAAQVDKFIATGLGLTHLDSHHHAHTYPEIFPVALALAAKLGVPLRQTGEVLKNDIQAAGVKTSDWFSAQFYGAGATEENLLRIIRGCPGGVLEIMSHPAAADETIFAVSSYNAHRETELAILTSPSVRRFFRGNGVELVGFADI